MEEQLLHPLEEVGAPSYGKDHSISLHEKEDMDEGRHEGCGQEAREGRHVCRVWSRGIGVGSRGMRGGVKRHEGWGQEA